MAATTLGPVPPQTLAHEALTRLAQADPAATCVDLGEEHGARGVERAQRHLRDCLASEPRPDAALGLFRSRLHADLPAASGDRRAALLVLMVAHGTARQHVPVPFDRATLERLR